MKKDNDQNPFYVRSVDKSNCVRLPQDIFQYLNSLVDDLSQVKDLPIIWSFSQSYGFLVSSFEDAVELSKLLPFPQKREIGYPTLDDRARKFVYSRCDDLVFRKNNRIQLPYHWNACARDTDVVVRRVKKLNKEDANMVQIIERNVWNERFPECRA